MTATTTTTYERFFTVVTNTPDSLPSYLYDHTRIVSRHDTLNGYSHFLLRTTAESEERVDYLANYQRDRLSSGLHGPSGVFKTEADALAVHRDRWDIDLTPPVDIDHAALQAQLRGPSEHNPTFNAYRNSNFDGTIVYLADGTHLEIDVRGTLEHVRGTERDLLQKPVSTTEEAFNLISSFGQQHRLWLATDALLRILEEDVPRSTVHWAVEQAKLPLTKLRHHAFNVKF